MQTLFEELLRRRKATAAAPIPSRGPRTTSQHNPNNKQPLSRISTARSSTSGHSCATRMMFSAPAATAAASTASLQRRSSSGIALRSGGRRMMMRPAGLWCLVLSLASFASVRTHLALRGAELSRESRSTLYRQQQQQQPHKQEPTERRPAADARSAGGAPALLRREEVPRKLETGSSGGGPEEQPFRLLAFGSSWNALDDAGLALAYPNLLSPSGARLVALPGPSPPPAASAASGPPPSLLLLPPPPAAALACTQSIVGDAERYDAVAVEFYEWTETHHRLAERLRSRFPRAALVLVRLWNPSQIVYESGDGSGSFLDLNSWRRQANLTLHSNEVGFQVLETGGPDRWSWRVPDDADRLERTRRELGATLHSLPGPKPADFSFPHNLNAYLQFFDPTDPDRLLSARGNSVLHAGLQALLRRPPHKQRKTSENPALRRQERNSPPELGSWGAGDDCHVWYSTGQYPEATTARRLDVVSVAGGGGGNGAAASHKHALELRRGDTLRVRNPFAEPRVLFLTYLTSCDDDDGPDGPRRAYPRVRVDLDGAASVAIDPFHDGCLADADDGADGARRLQRLHLTRTSPVGLVRPGETTLQFYPLDESASLPFRLVGASLLFEGAAENLVGDAASLEPEALALAGSAWGQLLWQ